MASESPTVRLEALRSAVAAAERRVVELEARARGAARDLDRATGPLTAYHEAVAAGERDPDPAEEARLQAAVTAMQADVVLQPSMAHGRVIGLEARNVRTEAELAGARRAVERARVELSTFAAESFEEIAVARLPRSRAVGERGRRALRELAAYHAERAAEIRFWRRLTDEAVMPGRITRCPVDGLDPRVVARLDDRGDVRGIAPVPDFLLSEGEVGSRGS